MRIDARPEPPRSARAPAPGWPSVPAMGTVASRSILAVSALCLVAAVLALYGSGAILDRDAFADRAVATLPQDEVGQEIATRFTDGVIERSPGLVTLRPALQA